MKATENKMTKIQAFVGKTQFEKLRYYAQTLNLPLSRLVSYAIENEIDKLKPFDLVVKLPKSIEYKPDTYAKEASKIVNFLRGQEYGMTLDLLLVLKTDIGLKSYDDVINGLLECIHHKILEKKTYRHKQGEHYRLKKDSEREDAVKKKTDRYELFQKLKREFQDE